LVKEKYEEGKLRKRNTTLLWKKGKKIIKKVKEKVMDDFV
jgi:hypothetical protein